MRIRRRTFALAAQLAALALVFVVTLVWALSYPRHMLLSYDGPRRGVVVQFVDGECSVLWTSSADERVGHEGFAAEFDPPWLIEPLSAFARRGSLYREAARSALGFGYVEISLKAVGGGATTQRAVWLPLWVVWVPLAVVTTARTRRAMQLRRRRRRGLCVGCGYDLRGSPERCPECGRATDGPASA